VTGRVTQVLVELVSDKLRKGGAQPSDQHVAWPATQAVGLRPDGEIDLLWDGECDSARHEVQDAHARYEPCRISAVGMFSGWYSLSGAQIHPA
jgi:hypothetical protein